MVGVGLVARHARVRPRCSTTSPVGSRCRSAPSSSALVIGLVYLTGVRAPLGDGDRVLRGRGRVAQVLGHAVYPWLRLSYGDDGGELGRAGRDRRRGVRGLFLAAGAVAFATQPPTVTSPPASTRGRS